jgi:glutathione synthase/RimK-type ligase-like ATP-grasp enzyme
MSDLLLLTPAPDEPGFGAGWLPWFERLATPLRARGLTVEAAPWTEGVEPARARAVLPLLAWGYHLRTSAWFSRLDALEAAGVRTLNPVSVLRWNTTKTYLVELAEKGAPVVPTLVLDRLTVEAVAAARETFGVETVVAKPQISGGSRQTVKLSRGDGIAAGPTAAALIQPFLPAVGEEGELSLFFFNGAFSHAVTKVAVAGDFRVQAQYGGQVSAVTPPAEAHQAARQVLEAAGGALTYARIDLIRSLDGSLRLMELEVIEPDLFLQYAADGGEAFAEAVARSLAG